MILRESNRPPPVNFPPLTGSAVQTFGASRSPAAIGVLLKRRTPGATGLARQPRKFDVCRALPPLPFLDFSGHRWQSIADRVLLPLLASGGCEPPLLLA